MGPFNSTALASGDPPPSDLMIFTFLSSWFSHLLMNARIAPKASIFLLKYQGACFKQGLVKLEHLCRVSLMALGGVHKDIIVQLKVSVEKGYPSGFPLFTLVSMHPLAPGLRIHLLILWVSTRPCSSRRIDYFRIDECCKDLTNFE